MKSQYVITGNLTKESISYLINYINTKGFVWRGFTDMEKEMLPSAAFYGVCNVQPGIGKYENCNSVQSVFIPGELERIGYYINNRNKLGEYPFEIPDVLSELLFPHTQGETHFLKNLKDKYKIDFYPKSNLLLQAISYVQHYFGGTSLLDFTVNPLKALFFSIGKNGNVKDSWLFGMPINIFQIHKNGLSDNAKHKFDLYLPSYYKNTRIRNQEGIFIYQLFDIISLCNGQECNYMNILKLFEDKFKNNNEMDLIDIEEKSKNCNYGGIKDSIGIFYVLLKIPKEEKPYLKHYLNSIGIDDNFMMGMRNNKM